MSWQLRYGVFVTSTFYTIDVSVTAFINVSVVSYLHLLGAVWDRDNCVSDVLDV